MKTISIEVPLGTLTRKHISDISSELDVNVLFSSFEDNVDQHLEVVDFATIGSFIVGIVSLIISLERRSEIRKWNLNKIKTLVRSKAAEYLGSDRITDIRFEDFDKFLQKQSNYCKVTAEINDEIYTFIIFQDGEVTIIKWEDIEDISSRNK